MDVQLEELEVDADEAAARTSTVAAFERKVVRAPCSCPDCDRDRISEQSEAVADTLEAIPRTWHLIQTVREEFLLLSSERIAQAAAPF